jgi:hypothetical protein
MSFVDPQSGAHTNTIESTWRHLKVFLGTYNTTEHYRYHLAHCMFSATCRAHGIPPFLQFLHIVASVDWENVQLHRQSTRATTFTFHTATTAVTVQF